MTLTRPLEDKLPLGAAPSHRVFLYSFATLLLEQKVDIRVIQVLLGHKRLETTALYVQIANDLLREDDQSLGDSASCLAHPHGAPRPQGRGYLPRPRVGSASLWQQIDQRVLDLG